jgi:hypothetical protein
MDGTHGELGTGPVFVGQSWFLHYWPWAMVVIGTVPLALGNLAALVVFFLPAVACGACLPWRFAVYGSGIALWFGFGKRRFVARSAVWVRAARNGMVVLPRGEARFGYPLTDGLVERDPAALRAALVAAGYELSP